MKKVVELKLFVNNEVFVKKVLETRYVKLFANISKLEELTYDVFANVRLEECLCNIMTNILKEHNLVEGELIIYNDYAEEITKHNLIVA